MKKKKRVVNAVILEKGELIENTKVMMQTLCDTTELEVEQSSLLDEMDTAVAVTERIIAENKLVATEQGEYHRCRNELVIRYEVVRDEYEKASREISDRQGRRKVYMRFIKGLQRSNGFCKGFGWRCSTMLPSTPRTTSASLSKMDLRVTLEFVSTKGR